MLSDQNTQVLVVGAGPAGLTAAITLARAGIETLVIERRAAPSPMPRATGVSTATMELLRSWGLEERARAAAMDVEWRALATPTLAEAASGTPVEVGFPSREQSAVVSPTGPACLAQDDLERVLQDHLATLPAARVERGVEVTGVESRADGVAVRTRDGRTLRARYLVGADGIRSTVRAALGIPAHGPGHVGESVGILFRAPVWDVVGEHRHVIYFVGDDGMKAALPVGLPDRWMVGLGDLDPADAASEVRRIVGVPDLQLAIENVARITYGVELAERYREGSAFLVGDAAHRLSPRGATGMNTAIRDGYDLAWKLAWVQRGWAGEELLDSYEAERRPVAEHNGVRGADPNGSVRGVAEELRVDLGGRIAHTWLPGEAGRVSTLDLLGDGLTLFTGPGEPPSWQTRRGAPPVTVRRLDAITARALGLFGGASLLVRPDGVPAAA